MRRRTEDSGTHPGLGAWQEGQGRGRRGRHHKQTSLASRRRPEPILAVILESGVSAVLALSLLVLVQTQELRPRHHVQGLLALAVFSRHRSVPGSLQVGLLGVCGRDSC